MRAAPGTTLLRIASAWLDERTVAGVFEPMVADAQRECFGSPATTRRLCLLRWRAAFAIAFAQSFVQQARQPLPWTVAATTGALVTIFFWLGSALLYAIWWAPWSPGSEPVVAPARLVISLSSTALPLALLPASILTLSRNVSQAWQARMILFWMTLISIAVLVPLGGWIIPRANQEYRVAHALQSGYRGMPARGDRELSLYELLEGRTPPDSFASTSDIQNARHNLGSRLVMPLTLIVLGAALAKHTGRRAVPYACGVWLLAGCGWFLLPLGALWPVAALTSVLMPRDPWSIVELAHYLGGLTYWIPHIVFIALALVLHRTAPKHRSLGRRPT